MDALWCSGLPWAQAAAIEAFDRAVRCAAPPPPPPSAPDYLPYPPAPRDHFVKPPSNPLLALLIWRCAWPRAVCCWLWCDSGGKPSRCSPEGPCHPARSERWLAPAQPSATRGLLRLDLRSRHLGDGLLRMRCWLHDVRVAIGNSSAPCLLDQTKRMCIVNTARELGGAGRQRAWQGCLAESACQLRTRGAAASLLVMLSTS